MTAKAVAIIRIESLGEYIGKNSKQSIVEFHQISLNIADGLTKIWIYT